LAALARPPFLPPLRPRATAVGSFLFAGAGILVLYVSAHERGLRSRSRIGRPTHSGQVDYGLICDGGLDGKPRATGDLHCR
jgi:hypothetical protein